MKCSKCICLLVVTVGLTFFSCQADPDFPTSNFIGKWEVASAERDGNVTKSLNKGYFEFFKEERVFTNILNTKDTLSYQFVGNKLKLADQEYIFRVVRLANDSLILKTRIKKTNFKINLIKEKAAI